jgi:hypothetical protein
MNHLIYASALALAMLFQIPQARALTFSDNFNSNVIDPAWWTVGADGGSTITAANGRVELTQGASGSAGLAFVLPIVGDFTATIDYTLLNWPTNNLERLGLVAYAGPNQQLAIERVSDVNYDPAHIGETYLTDFTGQGILGTTTTDVSGTLRLERTGNSVEGSYWNGSGWSVIGTYSVANEANVSRSIGIGIWPATPVTPGVKVAIDNFQLTAPSVPVPEPETYALMLAGVGLVGAAASYRKQVKV